MTDTMYPQIDQQLGDVSRRIRLSKGTELLMKTSRESLEAFALKVRMDNPLRALSAA
jgi:hypothetical protein